MAAKSALEKAVTAARTKVEELNAALAALALADQADSTQTLTITLGSAKSRTVESEDSIACVKATLGIKVSKEL